MLNLAYVKSKYNELSYITKATIWFTIANFFNMGISMLTTPIVSRLLTTSEYGVVSVYQTWESIFTVVLTLNLFCGIQEVYLAKNKEDENQVTGSLLVLCLTIISFFAICLFVFKNSITSLLDLDFKYLVMMLISIACTAIIQFWFTAKRFNYAYKVFTIVTLIKSVLRVVLSISFILMFPNDRVFFRLLGLAIPDYMFAVPILIYLLKKTRLKDLTKYWLGGFKFNIVLIPHYLSGILLSSSDRLMIASMAGDDKAGIYSMMYSCAAVVGLFYSAASSAISPYFLSCIKNKNYKDLNNRVINAILVTVLCAIFIILIAPEMLKFFAPKEYYEGISMIPVLIFGLYLNFFYLLFSNFAFYYEKKYFITCATLISAVINIVLNYLFIPLYGYKVAAYTTVIGYVFLAVINYFIYLKLSDTKIFDSRKLLIIMGIFLILTMLSVIVYSYSIVRIIMILFLCFIIYKYRKTLIQTLMR